MKRIATLTAALALASAAGLAQAQVSQDDFSTLVGPQAMQDASTMSRADVARERDQAIAGNRFVPGAEYQTVVGPHARATTSTVTRAQVVREREIARAQGAFEPGADYLNVLAAPNQPAGQGPSTYAGSMSPAGQ